MNIAEDMWLRGQAAQRNFLHVTSYSTAFAGTAALQALTLGLSAPRSFWAAMARAAAAPVGVPDASGTAAATSVVPMIPDTPVPTAAEAVAATPVIASAPVAVPDPVPETAGPSPHLLDGPRGGIADDLTVLTGVGAKLATALNEFGIYHFDQIAALDEEGIAWLDAQQKGFRMTCARYDIVGQARALS
jgi:predicted flap endonuclease-1-like 5' DNA nuclease